MALCSSCVKLLGPDHAEHWNSLNPVEVMNPLSRRDNETSICNDCGNAEALAEYYGITDQEARLRIAGLKKSK